jgi:hypothetical protein
VHMKLKAVLLAAIVAVAAIAFASCSDEPVATGPDTSGDTAAAETTLDELESRAAIPDDLPEEDFEGYLFRILTRSDAYSICDHIADLYAEQLTGEVINDAVFNRNRTVEERFNFKIKPIVVDSMDESLPTSTFKRSVMAGDDEYDMIVDHMIFMGMASLNHVFYNWYDVPHVNFDKPWWVSDATTKLTIDGKSFFALGDLSYNSLDYTYCMYFNKRIWNDHTLPLPYQKVRDHEWTIDYVMSITKDVYQDLNSNQEADDEDLYGYVSNGYSATVTYTWAFDNPITKFDQDGLPKLVLNNEKTPAILEKLNSFYNDYVGVNVLLTATMKDGRNWMDFVPWMFSESRAMLTTGMFLYAKMMFRDLQDDYGFLPYPLWDENQTQYYTMLDGHGPLFGIPVTVTDTKRTGIIVEAMSAEGYKIVTPAYYDVALKTKFTRDEESAEMIDLVLSTRTFDFGYMYDGWNGMAFYLQNLLPAKNTNFASYYRANEKVATRYYDRVIESYLEYDH